MLLRETNQSLFPVDPYRYRPELLDETQYDSYQRGLGQVDPVTAYQAGSSLLDSIANVFNIGAGRKEADMITPTQQRLMDTVLTPLFDRFRAYDNGVAFSYAELSQWQTALNDAWNRWTSLLAGPWDDGRAAQQAHSDIDPIFRDAFAKLQQISLSMGQQPILDRISSWFGADSPLAPVIPSPGSVVGPPAPPSYYEEPSGGFVSAALSPVVVGGVLLGMLLLSRRGRNG